MFPTNLRYQLGSRRIRRHSRRENHRAAAWFSCAQAARLARYQFAWF